ncbi:MAG: tetratricopeptide repeat protein, partial [Pirellulaceae bacterium]
LSANHHVAAYYWRGNAYYHKQEYDKAIADYTALIRIKPDHADAYYNRGYAYGNKGEKAKANADFAKAKELGYKPEQ